MCKEHLLKAMRIYKRNFADFLLAGSLLTLLTSLFISQLTLASLEPRLLLLALLTLACVLAAQLGIQGMAYKARKRGKTKLLFFKRAISRFFPSYCLLLFLICLITVAIAILISPLLLVPALGALALAFVFVFISLAFACSTYALFDTGNVLDALKLSFVIAKHAFLELGFILLIFSLISLCISALFPTSISLVLNCVLVTPLSCIAIALVYENARGRVE